MSWIFVNLEHVLDVDIGIGGLLSPKNGVAEASHESKFLPSVDGCAEERMPSC